MDARMRLDEIAANWRPPVELERSRPRDVRLTRAGVVLAVFAALLAAGSLASGVLLYLKAGADHAARRQVLDSGQDTVGRVVQRGTFTSGKDRRYWVEYEYLASGQVYAGRMQVGRSAWQELGAGARLPVRYVPSDPRRHIVIGMSGGLMPLWVPYLVAGGLSLGSLLVIMPLRSQRRLLAEGRPAPGIVTRHGRKSKEGIESHYVFRLLSGSVAEGKLGPQKKPPAVDTIVCVLYMPDRARRNSVYPLSLMRTPLSVTGRPASR